MATQDDFRRDFSQRFNQHLSRLGLPETGAGRVTEAAKLFEVSITTAQKWLSGAALPEPGRWPEICEVLKCSIEDLLFNPEQRSHVIPLGFTEVMIIDLIDGEKHERRILIEDKKGGPDLFLSEHLIIHGIYDNCMEPYAMSGDYIVCDRNNRNLRMNSVMLLRFNNETIVRRIQNLLDGRIVLICENSRYQPETVDADRFIDSSNIASISDLSKIEIIGTVVGRLLINR